ncbi:MAG: hypothetical protein R2713_01805 [Ilumatobacteraceae bacterium]
MELLFALRQRLCEQFVLAVEPVQDRRRCPLPPGAMSTTGVGVPRSDNTSVAALRIWDLRT